MKEKRVHKHSFLPLIKRISQQFLMCRGLEWFDMQGRMRDQGMMSHVQGRM